MEGRKLSHAPANFHVIVLASGTCHRREGHNIMKVFARTWLASLTMVAMFFIRSYGTGLKETSMKRIHEVACWQWIFIVIQKHVPGFMIFSERTPLPP